MPKRASSRRGRPRGSTRPWYRRPLSLALVAAALALAAVAAVAIGSGSREGGSEAAVPCGAQEMTTVHIHVHVQIYVRGQQRLIPPNVGIRPTCLYWLHTHDATGLVHVEAGAAGAYTLGQFFTVWSQSLSSTELLGERAESSEAVRVMVDGQPYAGDPRSIPLRAHDEIVVELGPPFASPAPFSFPPGT